MKKWSQGMIVVCSLAALVSLKLPWYGIDAGIADVRIEGFRLLWGQLAGAFVLGGLVCTFVANAQRRAWAPYLLAMLVTLKVFLSPTSEIMAILSSDATSMLNSAMDGRPMGGIIIMAGAALLAMIAAAVGAKGAAPTVPTDEKSAS